MEMVDSMSIIGGADGPTAVFLAGVVNTQVLVVSIVIGLILCIFGLKLMRVLSAVVGMLIGAAIGTAVVSLADLTGMVSLAAILGCGIVLALVSFFVRRVGAFFSALCYMFCALTMLLPEPTVLFLIFAGVVTLVLAVVAAIFVEPVVVIVSSVAGGLMAGPAIISLVGLEDKRWIGYIIAFVLAALGVFIQLLMQSGKIKKKDKIHAQMVKESDSMESEVEKARLILDDETMEETTEDSEIEITTEEL